MFGQLTNCAVHIALLRSSLSMSSPGIYKHIVLRDWFRPCARTTQTLLLSVRSWTILFVLPICLVGFRLGPNRNNQT